MWLSHFQCHHCCISRAWPTTTCQTDCATLSLSPHSLLNGHCLPLPLGWNSYLTRHHGPLPFCLGPLTPLPCDWLYVPLPLLPSEKVEWMSFYFIRVRKKAHAHRQTYKHAGIITIRLNTSKGQFSEKGLVPPSLFVTYDRISWWHICLLIKGGIKISGNLDTTNLMTSSWQLGNILLTYLLPNKEETWGYQRILTLHTWSLSLRFRLKIHSRILIHL